MRKFLLHSLISVLEYYQSTQNLNFEFIAITEKGKFSSNFSDICRTFKPFKHSIFEKKIYIY